LEGGVYYPSMGMTRYTALDAFCNKKQFPIVEDANPIKSGAEFHLNNLLLPVCPFQKLFLNSVTED